MAKRQISLLASLSLLLGSVAVMTFTPAAAEGTPEGYTANPTQKNILLEEGQYYKELTGFEGTGIRQADIDRKSDGELLYSTLSPNNGSKLAKVVHTKGSSGENRNIIKIFCMQFDNPDVGKDWSQAAYLQMYVRNPNATPVQLNSMDYRLASADGTKVSMKLGAKVKFYDLKDKAWSEITVTQSASPDVTNTCVELPGGAEGMLRIPLNSDTYAGYQASGMTNVSRFILYVQAPPVSAENFTVFIDDLGLIAEDEKEPALPDYTADPDFEAALLEGQTARLIQGFGAQTLEFSGDFSVANTHKSFTVQFAGDKGAQERSTAKYIQFEVENTSDAPLDLFYIKITAPGTGYDRVLTLGDSGSAFYDYGTKKWSSLTVGKAQLYEAPGLSVPAGSKGILRIPLSILTGGNVDNDNYVLNLDTSTLEIYANTPHATAGSTATFKNLALVAGADNVFPSDEGEPTDFPFVENPGKNVALQDEQTYKELNSFEKEQGVTFGCSENAAVGAFSGEGAKNGSKSYKLTFNNGGANAIAFPNFLPEAQANTDWSEAKAVQIYIDNTADTNAIVEDIKFKVGDTPYKLKREATVYFADMSENAWSQLPIVDGGNPAYFGVVIPGKTKGFLRIPLNADNFENFGEADRTAVTKMELFLQMPGCLKNSVLYLDDFGLVAGKDTELVSVDDYIKTDDVKLNTGETYKPLTGFEDGDKAGLAQNDPGNVEVSGEAKNNGEKSLMVKFVDGTAGGFRNFAINTSNVKTSNWSRAKYLQFYVENACPAGTDSMQLFYIQLNNGNKMLSGDATGLKLYDLATEKWSDLPVVGNSDHVLAGTQTKVPTVRIPAGFKGYVRIPLTNENFTNCTLSDELSNISRIAMFSLVKGVASGSKAYFDDFGLVTYDGDKAPDYEDGVAPGEDDEYDDVVTHFDLSGTITGPDGKPLAGATVTLNGETVYKTNSKGQYRFDGLQTGLLELAIVGADGTDYSYVTVEVLTGATTHFTDTNVRIAHDADGLTMDFTIGELGPELTAVETGAFVPEKDGGDNTVSDGGESSDGNTPSPGTGEAGKTAAAALLLLGAAGCFVFSRKKA